MTSISRLYPRLVVTDGAAAIDFYRAAFGAGEVVRYTAPGGRIVHAELMIGDDTIAVKDEADGDPAPTSLGGTPVVMELDVDDADAVAEAMVRAGASVVFPVDDRPYGRRDGRLSDPYGHLWIVGQRIEDLAPEDIQRRVDDLDG